MCENTITGLNNINDLRERVGLDKIQTRWHNNYLSNIFIENELNKKFELQKIDHFCSTYYLLTRVVKAWNCIKTGEEPKYNDDFNNMSSKLPSVGEFSPMRLYILKKV